MRIVEWTQTPTEQVVTVERDEKLPLLTVRYPRETPLAVIRNELLAMDLRTCQTVRVTDNEVDVTLLGVRA